MKKKNDVQKINYPHPPLVVSMFRSLRDLPSVDHFSLNRKKKRTWQFRPRDSVDYRQYSERLGFAENALRNARVLAVVYWPDVFDLQAIFFERVPGPTENRTVAFLPVTQDLVFPCVLYFESAR